MAECNHDWQRKPDAPKERCVLCGAARLFDENRCNHDYQPRDNGGKESCTKCGAARVVLQVHDMTGEQSAPEVN
jgi:ferredoxin-like protein FixX